MYAYSHWIDIFQSQFGAIFTLAKSWEEIVLTSLQRVSLFLLFAEESSTICRSSSDKVIHLSGFNGTFFTPNYPAFYATNWTCIWLISVPAGKRVKLTFEYFSLKSDDAFQIRDGKSPRSPELRRFDVNYRYDVYSTGSYMWVKFHSGFGSWFYKPRGFKARFEALDPREYLFIYNTLLFFGLSCRGVCNYSGVIHCKYTSPFRETQLIRWTPTRVVWLPDLAVSMSCVHGQDAVLLQYPYPPMWSVNGYQRIVREAW